MLKIQSIKQCSNGKWIHPAQSIKRKLKIVISLAHLIKNPKHSLYLPKTEISKTF